MIDAFFRFNNVVDAVAKRDEIIKKGGVAEVTARFVEGRLECKVIGKLPKAKV